MKHLTPEQFEIARRKLGPIRFDDSRVVDEETLRQRPDWQRMWRWLLTPRPELPQQQDEERAA